MKSTVPLLSALLLTTLAVSACSKSDNAPPAAAATQAAAAEPSGPAKVKMFATNGDEAIGAWEITQWQCPEGDDDQCLPGHSHMITERASKVGEGDRVFIVKNENQEYRAFLFYLNNDGDYEKAGTGAASSSCALANGRLHCVFEQLAHDADDDKSDHHLVVRPYENAQEFGVDFDLCSSESFDAQKATCEIKGGDIHGGTGHGDP